MLISKKHEFSDYLSIYFSGFVENVKYYPLNENISYWKYDFSSISGDIYAGYLKYYNQNVFIKFGRDDFHLGHKSFDRILFSNYSYPYDQLLVNFNSNNFNLYSFYLLLNNHPLNSDSTRHINGHRVEYIYDNGYISINEIALYGGYEQSANIALFNPLLIYYLYQNYNKFNSNIIYSVEWQHRIGKTNLFFEFVLDDIQFDRNVPADLEPPEYGVLFELNSPFNKKYEIKFNILKISNRTFNAPVFSYEKFINNSIPISHPSGNNFWKSTLGISGTIDKLSFNTEYIYIEKGEDALYGNFNKDYLNYTIDEGYSEDFPFGKVEVMHGPIVDLNYLLSEHISLGTSLSYFLDSYLDNTGFNYLIAFSFNY